MITIGGYYYDVDCVHMPVLPASVILYRRPFCMCLHAVFHTVFIRAVEYKYTSMVSISNMNFFSSTSCTTFHDIVFMAQHCDIKRQ